jgi:hypothetical protein
MHGSEIADSAIARPGRPASHRASPGRGLQVAAITLLAMAARPVPAAETPAAARALARFAVAWQGVHDYRCTITAHEVLGRRVQDRVYRLAFEKPHDTRLAIVSGDGRGGVAVWRGGPKVRGHRGGFLSFLNLTLGLHNALATTLRGTTIAQANFGALLDHWQQEAREASVQATRRDDSTVLSATHPPGPEGVTREALDLGADGLPVGYEQFEGDRLVKRVRYRDVELNVPIPAATFSL